MIARLFAVCRCRLAALLVLVAVFAAPPAQADRLKDIASIAGVRDNQLVGYGLVVGLDGTGDQTTQTPFTVQSMNNMLANLGVRLPPGTNLQVKNVASVMVTADLPAFARPGQQIDVTVSSIGNAKSLRGGTLIMTPLKGADGQVYAIAQGNLLVGGASANAPGGGGQTINHMLAGRIPRGATVERAVQGNFGDGETVTVELNRTDFGTARKVLDAINGKLGAGLAQARDARTIEVRAPLDASARVSFLGRLEELEITPEVAQAKVIINSRTGSVVMNQLVTLDNVAVAHGNLTVTIGADTVVSQPAPMSGGRTVAGQRGNVSIDQPRASLVNLAEGASLDDVVKALTKLGATPMDLVSILQALKAAGSLHADLEVI